MSQGLDPDLLLRRIKEGGSISRSDYDRVASELSAPRTKYRRYTLLHILGRGEQRQYRSLVERFVADADNPMLARLAINILVGWWGLWDDYKDWVFSFAEGVAWDDGEDVRLIALSMLGERLRRNDEEEVARALFEVATNPDVCNLTRFSAMTALGRGLGYEHKDLPEATRSEAPNSPWSMDILRQTEKRWPQIMR